jgi:dTDP-4-amino-4,6-dideoxygalactose transaminase
MILCSNPQAQYLAHQDEIDRVILQVLNKGWYILGDEVKTFEAEFAGHVGVRHGVGVGSGTDAIHLALRACEIGQGDEVITVSHTAVATVSAIESAGATPVLVDIEPDFYTIDPARLKAAISSKTKAIVPVHLYGQTADLTPILDIAQHHGLRVFEDCAQAHGALYRGRRVGSYGDISCFSFYPTKNLGAIGDGGILVTDDAALAERALLLRQYGWVERYVSSIQGWNSRLDEVQAAVLRIKLPYLDGDNARRADLADEYDEHLAGLDLVLPRRRPDTQHVFHLYVVRSPRRDELQTYLKSRGIGALVHYPVPVHLQPAYHNRLRGSDNLPETERAAREVLSLPMYPELAQEQLQTVVSEIRTFLRSV